MTHAHPLVSAHLTGAGSRQVEPEGPGMLVSRMVEMDRERAPGVRPAAPTRRPQRSGTEPQAWASPRRSAAACEENARPGHSASRSAAWATRPVRVARPPKTTPSRRPWQQENPARRLCVVTYVLLPDRGLPADACHWHPPTGSSPKAQGVQSAICSDPPRWLMCPSSNEAGKARRLKQRALFANWKVASRLKG